MGDKKFSIWDDENLIYESDNSELFSLMIAVHYPLGDFIRVDDADNRTVITFSNYWININK